jgi:hypothetical protein
MNNSININIYSSWNIIWINVMEHLLYIENYKNYFDVKVSDINITNILNILEQKINLNINNDITQGLISLLNIIVEYFYFDKKPFKLFLNNNIDLLKDILKLFKKHFDMSHIIDNQLKLIISVPSDISNKIWTNIYGYKYKIVDWINPHTTFDWILPLNKNPHIIDFIKYKIDNFDLNSTLFWENLTENEYAIDLILDNWHLIPEKQEYERFYDLNSLTGHYEDNFELVKNYNYFWHCLALNTNDRVIDIIYEYYDFINKTSDLVISLIEREIKITNLNDSLNKQEHIIKSDNSLHLIERIINENFREVSNIMLWSKLALINNDYAIKILLNNNATLNIDILTSLFINSNKIAYKIFVDIVINNDISGYQVSIDKYNLLDVIKYYNEHYDSYDKYYQIFDNDNIVNLLIDKYEEYKSSNDYLIFIAQHHNDKIVNLIIKNYQNIISQSNKFIKYFAMNKNILAVKFLLGMKNNLPIKFWTYFAKNKNVIAIKNILENYISFNNLDFWNNLLLNDEEQIDDTGIIDLISKNWDDIFQVIKQNFINGDNLNKSKKFLENLAINKRAIKLVENNFLDILELIGGGHFYNVFLMYLYKNPNILIKDNSLNKYMENIYMIYETILYS